MDVSTKEGKPGTRRQLAAARVLIVGAGGLGCPAALTLAAAGVGTLVLVDPDRVELSNLNRQILHRTATIGAWKTESAGTRLNLEFPRVCVETVRHRLEPENAVKLFERADFVIDGTDRVEAKFLINDVAVRTGKPYSHAGILGFHGQTMTVLPGRSACYRCLFPEIPDENDLPTCQTAGIIGALAGVIGSIQALEAIKFLSGEGELLADRMLMFDAASMRVRQVRLSRSSRCPVCASAASGAAAEHPDNQGLSSPRWQTQEGQS